MRKHPAKRKLLRCCAKNKAKALAGLWLHPLHTRAFGNRIDNVLRCLQLEVDGYQVSTVSTIQAVPPVSTPVK